MTARAILVFARRPELGLVKTRLHPFIGEAATLALYRAFLADTLHAAGQSSTTTLLAHTSGPHFPEQDLADIAFEQRGSSFAERFDAALEDAANQLPNQTPLVLIGADTPYLSPKFLRKTFDVLKTWEAVIGPNVNGGFYLLGFASHPVPVSEVFSRTSTEEPTELLRLLNKARLRTTFLESQFDVDLPQDLMMLIRLIDRLEASDADLVPKNTRNALHDMGILSSVLQTVKARP
jgi:glycosyltransferase A (GT-A) superfamily protein (DUF2064 family)